MDQSKCEFMLPSVKFLAYRVDGEGQHPKDVKIAALSKAPSPKKKGEKKKAELLSYYGLLNFYGNFIRDLSTLLQPLHKLLQKGVK